MNCRNMRGAISVRFKCGGLPDIRFRLQWDNKLTSSSGLIIELPIICVPFHLGLFMSEACTVWILRCCALHN